MKKIPIADCPRCGRIILYSSNPTDKKLYKTELAAEDYVGRFAQCNKCKSVVNPAKNCKLPPKRSREMQILTKEEMQRLLIQAKEEGFYEMFLLDISTGLRRGELLALKWDDVDFNTGEIRISRQVNKVEDKLVSAERPLRLPKEINSDIGTRKL